MMLNLARSAGIVVALLSIAPLADEPRLVLTRGIGRGAAPGDRGELDLQETPSSPSEAELGRFVLLEAARDRAGMDAMIEAGDVARLPAGTPFLVIRSLVERAPPPRAMTGAEMGRHIQAEVSRGPQARPLDAVELRVLDGPLKGRAVFVQAEKLALYRPAPPPPPAPKAKPAPKVATPEGRALGLLNAGLALERAGKPEAALANYRRIVAEFSATPSAVAARGRIAALAP